jgi:hypothetical protein
MHDTFPAQWANELANNQILQLVLQVMDDSHPARFALDGDRNDDVSPTRAAIELGLTRGYSKYADTLRLLARRKPKPADLGEPSYEAPPP